MKESIPVLWRRTLRQAGFFDLRERREKLPATRDFLYRANRFVAWESVRPVLDKALKRSTGDKGGRPPFDAALMFKVLARQALYNNRTNKRNIGFWIAGAS